MKHSRILHVVALLMATFTLLYAGWAVRSLTTPAPWSPLGDYPVQTVTDRAGGGNVPTVYIGRLLHVHGVKCNTTGAPVTVRGQSEWISIIPPGTILAHTSGTATRAPGCSARDYENPIPAEVAVRDGRAALIRPRQDPGEWLERQIVPAW